MSELKLLEVRYLGRVKLRADGSLTAFGWSGGAWSVAITKDALYTWFGVSLRPGEAGTLYSVLGVTNTAAIDEIKKAYRRLAKQWHPDVCREADAAKQFQAIQHAYDILSGDKRAKYDAGLTLQSSLRGNVSLAQPEDDYGYRSPLRCGHILGQGSQQGRKFVIAKILQWSDIVNTRGQTLVVSWPYGADVHTEAWVNP